MSIIVYETIKPEIDYELLEYYDYNERKIKLSYPQLKLIRSEKKARYGYCYNYALKDYSDTCMFAEDTYRYLKHNYRHINLKKIKIGDIITIHDDFDPDEDNVNHYARIVKTDNTIEGTIIRSKWGIMGVWEGKLEYIPDIYGNYILFWRKIKND